MQKTDNDKAVIRAEMRKVKSKLSSDYKASAADVIFRRIEQMPAFMKAESVLLYHSLPDEVPTHDVIVRWAAEKKVYLPVVRGDVMLVGRYDATRILTKGAFDIFEPCDDAIATDTEVDGIDVVIVPAVALARNGARLGRGKGYYDKFLRNILAVKVGVVCNEQLLDELPCDDNDVKMDYVITPGSFYYCK